MPAPTVRPVNGTREREAFVRLPWLLHAKDPYWAPPLLSDARKTLSPDYPFFGHGEAVWLVAWRNGKPVGRMTAHVNHAHLEKYGDGRGFFGWFECENDAATSEALFGAGIDWLLARKAGLTHMRGPLNWDINGECPGVLLAAESDPGLPVFLMAHSPDYYPALVEAAGFSKCQDLLAYTADNEPAADAKQQWLDRIAEAARRRLPAISMRPLNTGSGYKDDMETVRVLFNEAWADNWGALGLTPEEMAVIAKGLKPIVRPELTSILSIDGKPAGCFVCIPDINPLLKKINGRLFPFGWLTLLLGMRKTEAFRTMLMGVASEYRGRGLDAVLIAEIVRKGRGLGYRRAEMSWVLESNAAMNSIASKLGRPYRRYRIYEREL